ncbi:hypothetical protein [Undibacterium sp. TC9W]|uniref:hypothetical protein n=1 Tax=Undibacterium sp. TC9W TaxID=3413053 RepID=UPI003BF3BD18
MKLWIGLLIGALLGTAGGFVTGKNKGISEGYENANLAYNNWTSGFMHRDPDLRLDGIFFAPDGARINLPKCDPSESLYGIAFRQPDLKNSAKYHESAVLKREKDVAVLHIPDAENQGIRAAVVLGCETKREAKAGVLYKDLTKSWEFPSNLR